MSELGWLTQPAVFPWLALALGLCVGSFLNVVIYRLPRMMERAWREEATEILAGEERVDQGHTEPTLNLVIPRSACPACGHKIPAWENVPVFSWLALRGRCSACGTRISLRYPVVELLAGIGATFAAWKFGSSLAAVGAALF